MDYINNELVTGTASNALINALPALLQPDGFGNEAALRTISPEAYASAAAIGIENGLALGKAVRRSATVGKEGKSGVFTFGQFYGNWHDFDGDSRGVSQADVRNTGFFGGLGFGSPTFAVAGFVGRTDSREAVPGISAVTNADGMFFGGKAQVKMGAFDASASLIVDRSEADTERSAAGVAANSHYDLHGTTLDAEIGYALPVGAGVHVRPSARVTHVAVTRGRVQETGGGAFALTVPKRDYDATFLTGDLTIGGSASASLEAWTAFGVRYRIDGDDLTASGKFASASGSYAVDGGRRPRTRGHVAAGVSYQIAPQLSLYTDGEVEIGDSNGGRQINAGARLRF